MVFWDLDGVLVNFHKHIFDDYGIKSWPRGVWSISEVLGISESLYWERIEEDYPNFWENLEPTEEFDKLVSIMDKFDSYIATTPTRDPLSCSGKVQWIYDFLPSKYSRRYFLTHHKGLLAAPGRVLVDDGQHNCDIFNSFGGHSFLYPRPWNFSELSIDDLESFIREHT